VEDLMSGRHPFCKLLKKAKNPCVIVGSSFRSINVISALEKVFLNNLNKKATFNLLSPNVSSVSFNEIGISAFNPQQNQKYDILFLVGTNSVSLYRKLNPNSLIIYIGSHYSVTDLKLSDVILPSCLFIEKDSKHLNTEGLLQKSNRLRSPVNESRPEWSFFQVLSNLSGNGKKEVQNLNSFYSSFSNEYPFIQKNKKKLPTYKNLNYIIKHKSTKDLFGRNLEDFYVNNFLTKSSKTMILCSNNKEQKNFL
jgi:NADH dehydrogenase/NADH:ubiquinone oxidoreductase subunit G